LVGKVGQLLVEEGGFRRLEFGGSWGNGLIYLQILTTTGNEMNKRERQDWKHKLLEIQVLVIVAILLIRPQTSSHWERIFLFAAFLLISPSLLLTLHSSFLEYKPIRQQNSREKWILIKGIEVAYWLFLFSIVFTSLAAMDDVFGGQLKCLWDSKSFDLINLLRLCVFK
jgi:hypothetical protein